MFGSFKKTKNILDILEEVKILLQDIVISKLIYLKNC